MRSTPLKVGGYAGFPGLGNKRGSEQQGPSALDLVAAGTAGALCWCACWLLACVQRDVHCCCLAKLLADQQFCRYR
jgi:hypothetical protein